MKCDCCSANTLRSYPKPYTDELQIYEWIENDPVAIMQGDITPFVTLCPECHALLRDKNWEGLAKRNRGSNA